MSRKLIELTATVAFEKQRWPGATADTLILDATTDTGDDTAIKCQSDGDEPQLHLTYRFYGGWSGYTNKRTGLVEKQFHAKTFIRCQPHGRRGVISYLRNAPGIGMIIATRLYDKFESDAVRILREQPDVAAAAVERLTPSLAANASEWLTREAALEGCTIDLIDLLDGRGFPKAVSKQAVKQFGNRAADIIKANPYRLMQFRGCGFKRADALYLELGLPPARMKRQALCAWHAITQQSTGDTWHFVEVAKQGLKGAIAGADVNADKAIELAVRGRVLSMVRTDGRNGGPDWDGDMLWVAEQKKARAERRLAGFVQEAVGDDVVWPLLAGLPGCIDDEISDHQNKKLTEAIQGPLAILGGSPGTGKTFTAAKVIGQLVEIYGAGQIGVAAPTGKAAVRLTEALAEYNLPLRARTWHSLLKVEQADDGGGWSFEHNRNNPLPFKVLIGDESSMIDTDLAASIFAARARGTLVLLIGDINQLPPVGHGAPLRDMIAAGVPYGELTEIRRNSGVIVEACAAIRDGKRFEFGGNLVGMHDPDQAAAMLWRLQSESEKGFDPVWDCQVLVAVNRKSDLSRHELNKVLQGHLNPNPAVQNQPFRLNDKVVNTRNSWCPPVEDKQLEGDDVQTNERGQVYVANGDLGRVVKVEPKYFHVRLSSPDRLIVVPRGESNSDDDSDTGCNWDLGYALSVHKSQGSEFPVVIVMVDDSAAASRVCTREWLYTAISRAKQCCYLIGKESVAQQFVKRTAIDKRTTFLRSLIVGG